MSARRSRSSGSLPCSGCTAKPTLARTLSTIPSSTKGWSSVPTSRVGEHLALVGPGAGEEHGELVAAEAGERVGGAQRAAQPARDLLEQPVAVGVAERVVDGLEVVEVDDHQHERLAGLASMRSSRSRSSTRFGSPVSASCIARCASRVAWRAPK